MWDETSDLLEDDEVEREAVAQVVEHLQERERVLRDGGLLLGGLLASTTHVVMQSCALVVGCGAKWW